MTTGYASRAPVLCSIAARNFRRRSPSTAIDFGWIHAQTHFFVGGGTVFCPNARKEFHIPRPRSLQLRRSSGPSRELICRFSSIRFPIFRTFLGDFNLQKLPSRRLEVLREWKNRVLLEEHYIFNVATPLGGECEHYSTTSTTTPATTTAATTTATPPGHSTSQIHTVNPSLSMVFSGF